MPPGLDVVIPSLGRPTLARALRSLAAGEVLPDQVTVVSNEADPSVAPPGLPVRILRFASERYAYGHLDVALRRNVGIFASTCTHVATFDDDQVAPRQMVAELWRALERGPVVWGHHRFADLDVRELDELLDLHPEHGRAREHPPNAWHLYHSCYGGLFAGEREVVVAAGGFDLAFLCRHAGEDQDLGRRLARRLMGGERVFIPEPPFAWHPTSRAPSPVPARSNVCPDGVHRLVREPLGAAQVDRCLACPFFTLARLPDRHPDGPLLRYDPALVGLEVVGASTPGGAGRP